MTDYRVIVLGLGGIGSAAAYWASRQFGESVLGLEQFSLGHVNGGSEDHSRIIRLSYHTPEYVGLARSAYEAWSVVEAEAGENLVLRTGGLDLAPIGASIGLDSYRSSMAAAGVPFEELTSDEVMRRWSQWRLPEDVSALFQPESGLVKAARANAAHRHLARRNGAALVDNQAVTSISEAGGEVHVSTSEGSYTAESLIVASGAWTNSVLQYLGMIFPLEVTLEQVVYLTALQPDLFQPDRFPIWIWMTVPSFYGFPIFGEPAVKVAWDRCEVVTDPETRSYDPREDVTKAVIDFVTAHLPEAAGPVHLAKTCLYTLTPDRDFIVDRVPGTTNVYTAVGAGHAFKFASLIGRILVELASAGTTSHDIRAFGADRAILREAEPLRSYMV